MLVAWMQQPLLLITLRLACSSSSCVVSGMQIHETLPKCRGKSPPLRTGGRHSSGKRLCSLSLFPG